MLELRIRACHATGEFTAKDNRAGEFSGLKPRRARRCTITQGLPIRRSPVTRRSFKVEERLPAARTSSFREHKLNEFFAGDLSDIGNRRDGRAL